MDEVRRPSRKEREEKAQLSIAGLLEGSGHDQACRIAWGMTERGDPLRLMHAAKNAGIDHVINAIREQTLLNRASPGEGASCNHKNVGVYGGLHGWVRNNYCSALCRFAITY
jgi:hypothetical protein